MTDMKEENVVQPLLVSHNAIKQASECVRSILKIDDIVSYLSIPLPYYEIFSLVP